MINVIVTGVDTGSVGLQIVKALKMEGHLYRIHGTNIIDSPIGKKYVDVFHLVSNAKSNSYIDEILTICSENNVLLIFPGSENELLTLSLYSKLFRSRGTTIVSQDFDLVNLCLDKLFFLEKLGDIGIETPETHLLNREYLNTSVIPYPVVIKPLSGSGSKNVHIIQSERELQLHFELSELNRTRLIVQEYISAREGEYTVSVLTDPKTGDIRSSVVMKRYIQSGISNKIAIQNRVNSKTDDEFLYISSGITQGEFLNDLEVSRFCEMVSIKLNSKSVLNFQCRKKEGKIFLFEINPRFSGTTFARALAGRNEPHLLAQRIVHGTAIPLMNDNLRQFLFREITDYVIENVP